MNGMQEPMAHTYDSLMDWVITNSGILLGYCVNLVAAILILFVGSIVVKAIAGAVSKGLEKKNMDKAVIGFIHGLVRYLLMTIVAIAALSRVGVETASVIAIIGAAGLAVGLALQGSLSNFAAGVIIVAFRPFRSGDYVSIAGVAGSVESIHIFQTVLITPDNKVVIVPNTAVIGNPITNFSRNDTRRIDLVIGVSYKADLLKAKAVLKEVLDNHPMVLKDPAYNVAVLELADSSVNFVVRPWVNTGDYWTAYFEIMEQIKLALDSNGVEIPFPQMDVHVKELNKAA